jgi:hypothetical protein
MWKRCTFWSLRSPDLTQLKFFQWGFCSSTAFSTGQFEGGNRRATAKTEDLNNYLKVHPRPGHEFPEGE